jgi:cation diffusion facilitator CzcD-associated flavoprotein CzcO
VLAVGILNLMKLPTIPGMEDFAGRSFHTARWDYEYTGGGPHEPLTGLADKVVALIGTGASGIQCVPPLAESAKHLYVFQRTPSAIGERGNRPTDPDFAHGLEPGWQRARMDNFQAIMLGRPGRGRPGRRRVDAPLRRRPSPPADKGMTMAEFMRSAEELDYGIMERTGAGSRSWWPTRPRPRSSSRTTGTSASGPASTTSTCRPSTTPTSR